MPNGNVTGLSRKLFAAREILVPCAWPLLLVLAIADPPSAVATPQVSFRNDVMAVLSKAGCNAGTCHGNKNGKGGFKLSLRGQDPELDYFSLTRDVSARRVNPIAADESLILLKPTGEVPHEGGLRLDKGSHEYEFLRQWIAQRVSNDLDSAPKL